MKIHLIEFEYKEKNLKKNFHFQNELIFFKDFIREHAWFDTGLREIEKL